MVQKGKDKEESDKTYSDKIKKHREKWDKLKFDTQIICAGEDPYPETSNSLRTPIFATKSYVYSTFSEMLQHHYFYSRTENPTLFALDNKLATLHRGDKAVSVASGMAAVHCACMSVLQERVERIRPRKISSLLPQNNPEKIPNVIIHTNQYTGSYRLITKIYPQMGITFKRVNLTDLSELEKSIDDQTKLVYVETPANPTVDIIDIETISEMIRENGGKCIVDNTWASPALQKPLELGADLVVESLTKYINGHGDCLGGAVVGEENDIRNIRYFWLETQGAVMSPFNAWLILRGIRTLSMRMERHSSNATLIAEYLQEHPKVPEVVYPALESHPGHELAKKQMNGFGGMVSFDLETEEECYKFIDELKLIKVGVSLGDTTSLIEYTPVMTGIDLAGWERRSMNISNTNFRFSVGLEDAEDLIRDLEQALDKI
ncbi:MAG: aminotransferase class I/II-fold pyridoxal phosphate-dependent enzyme [Candidatus Lokiarchaeota archaeon]|nr:aminotransferase class I/II-fold pyridoxal phosphate-dependent enzyme [Candidatus Lokiarchaeota archaeon]MBD3339433.1 aminotransferase class I/II-fold pyridoxal phosphate-dependent enzyme [Candidatus Lokiarchaeota archaeon]